MTGIRPLSWGRRYLICRPVHFRVDYAINPWMDVDSAVDPARALAQWDTLVATLRAAGAEVEQIDQLATTPDMVYAMNYGIVDGDHVAITNFRYDQRRPEAEAAEWWFGEAGLRTTRIGDAGVGAFEAGDAFLVGDTLLVASGPRTDRTTHQVLADAPGAVWRLRIPGFHALPERRAAERFVPEEPVLGHRQGLLVCRRRERRTGA